MKKRIVFFSLFLVMIILIANTPNLQQSDWSLDQDLQKIAKKVSENGWVYFNDNFKPDPYNFFSDFKTKFNLSEFDEMKLVKEGNDSIFKYYRFERYYKGILVEGSGRTLKYKNDNLLVVIGRPLEKLDIDINSVVRPEKALDEAKNIINATKYSWEDQNWESSIKRETNDKNSSWYPKAELIITKTFDGTYRLAYTFNIATILPKFDYSVHYVDAHNSTYIKSRSLVFNGSSPCITWYNGQQIITDYYMQGHWWLIDQTRGWICPKSCVTDDGSDFDGLNYLQDWDDYWDWVSERSEVSAMWAVQRSYDYFNNTFSWTGTNDNNKFIRIGTEYPYNQSAIVIYPNRNYDYMFFGYRNGHSLTALDIVGHEYTHGVVYYLVGLQKIADECGVLAESFSDFFGERIESYTTSDCDWIFGADVDTIRSFISPEYRNQPDYYHGDRWCWDDEDVETYIHINSGVPNHMFYLLAEGDAEYDITGIGISLAATIAFRSLDWYLESDATFAEARDAFLDVALNYGDQCYYVYKDIMNAWAAVGVGEPAPNPCIVPLTIDIYGPTTATCGTGEYYYSYAYGGNGNYSYEWSVNFSTYSYNQNIYYYFPEYQYGTYYFTVTVTDGEQTAYANLDTYVDCYYKKSTVGDSLLLVYPNPVSSVLTLRINKEMANVDDEYLVNIYDRYGKKMYSNLTKEIELQIDVSPFISGNYFVTLSKDGKQTTIMFIKK